MCKLQYLSFFKYHVCLFWFGSFERCNKCAVFLAVHDSPISDLLTQKVSQWLFSSPQSPPEYNLGDLWPFWQLIRKKRRLDISKTRTHTHTKTYKDRDKEKDIWNYRTHLMIYAIPEKIEQIAVLRHNLVDFLAWNHIVFHRYE